MLYLLDANVLIDANRDYYPLDRVPPAGFSKPRNAANDRSVARECKSECHLLRSQPDQPESEVDQKKHAEATGHGHPSPPRDGGQTEHPASGGICKCVRDP